MPTPNLHPQSDPAIFKPISDLWLTLQPQYSRLRAACQNAAQRKELDQRYTDAENTFWAAVKNALVDKNDTVKDLITDLKTLTQQLKGDLQSLQNIARVINLIANGVKLAASLVTLAAP